MPYFKDEDEVYRYIGGIFTEVLADPELGPEFKATEVIMGLHFTGPNSRLVIDVVEGKVYTGAECDSGPAPNIEMFMTADIAHQFWLGKVNVSQALAKGQMRAKGPVPTILKLVPIASKVFPRYEKLINERTDV
ncbi:MAG: sterol carrier protein [Actinomycetota bacterium]|jgi:putative sterol carrier protein